MSEKGICKKANGPGWDYDPDNKRAKERRRFAFWVWRVTLGVAIRRTKNGTPNR